MPGFVIHIAVAKQYFNKHKFKIKDEEEFIKGSIAPDLDDTLTQISNDKNKSHYGKWYVLPVEINIDEFLADKNVDINSDYWKGYLLHLLTDYYFYNYIFKDEALKVESNNDYFYYDYDCLNSELMEKYHVPLYENIKKYVHCINKKPKYLDKTKIINFIDKVSDLDLENEIKIVNKKGMEGLIDEYKN